MTTRVKICGITRVDDALAAARAGASAIGLVFWPGSPRCVTVKRAAEIASVLLQSPISLVGVFVDQPPALVHEIVRTAKLDAIQLHGDESVTSYEFNCPVIKAVAVGMHWDAAALDAIPAEVLPLLDAADTRGRGGTGRQIDWGLGAAASARRRILLAGGLRPDNVALAIASVSPYGIDVSSGLETRPGVKDAGKMREFLAAVTAASGPVPPGLFS
jgi:phosphoribosylanthranilate isomerase